MIRCRLCQRTMPEPVKNAEVIFKGIPDFTKTCDRIKLTNEMHGRIRKWSIGK